jgi:hypothetical protein
MTEREGTGVVSPSLAEHEDRLGWIFGSSRSGSSWLLRMLSEIEDVVPIDDPHLGHHLGVWRPIALAWATASRPPELDILSELKRDYDDYFFSDKYRDAWQPALKDLIQRRFDAQLQEALAERPRERPTVLVKEPGSHVADWIAQMFPHSNLIFLLRDGRDVVDSWLDAYQAGSWGERNGMYAVSKAGREPLVRWQSTVWLYRTEVVQRAYENHDPAARILVRYENLRRDPVVELERVCSTLGVEASRERIEAAVSAHAFERVPGTEKGPGKEIRRASPGGWREHMSAAEIEAMHEVMGEKLTELGYLREDEAALAV